jgi:hypothetical protein
MEELRKQTESLLGKFKEKLQKAVDLVLVFLFVYYYNNDVNYVIPGSS